MAWLGARQTRAGVTASENSGFGLVLTIKRMVAAPAQQGFGETQWVLLCDLLLRGGMGRTILVVSSSVPSGDTESPRCRGI